MPATREIPLSGKKAAGRAALVDDEDYELVSVHRWHLWDQKGRHARARGPYAYTTTRRPDGGKTTTAMHNLIMGRRLVDHVNHDGLDNRRENLRPATIAQNNHNQRPRAAGSSRFKGVTWHRRVGKWQATIKLNGRCVYLGVFAIEEEAALAYDAAALEAYGEYAYLNGVAA
jgi:hypothetical protein